MKVSVVVVAAALILATGSRAAAQDGFPYFVGGFLGGTNTARLTTDPSDGTSSWRTSFVAGGFGRMQLTDNIGVQPEVLFGRYGGKEEEVINGEPIEFKVTLDYVHIPVLAHISGAQRNIARAFAVVGPSFGFRTGATRTVVDLSTDASDQFKKNEVAFVLGGGVELLSAIIQLRYTIGMTDILTDFGHGLYAITSAKNQSVQLMGGVSLFGYRKPRQ